VATYLGEWVALLCFSAAAWKCAVRDRWIGWGYRHQYDRLNLVANNSRFLILPDWHRPNLGSRTLSLCERRLPADWQGRFGHPLVLLETFVDPGRYQGIVYKAANWFYLGDTRGFRRTRQGLRRRNRPLPQEGVCQALAGQCPGRVVQPPAGTPLPYRRP